MSQKFGGQQVVALPAHLRHTAKNGRMVPREEASMTLLTKLVAFLAKSKVATKVLGKLLTEAKKYLQARKQNKRTK